MSELSEIRKMPDYSISDIEQVYLLSEKGLTRRIRYRKYPSGPRFYVTEKRRIDRLSAEEREREITREEYVKLCAERDPITKPIKKRRYTFSYLGQLFEIDIYPDWENTAIMETELDSREQTVQMPSFIRIVREVTGIVGYSNAAMSRDFPEEDEI